MRNVFVSYAQLLDQSEADEFRKDFGGEIMDFSNRSLENVDLNKYTNEIIKITIFDR